MMWDRDPRRDPRRGDVFTKGTTTRVVLEAPGDEVIFRTGNGRVYKTTWQKWTPWAYDKNTRLIFPEHYMTKHGDTRGRGKDTG